jgi:hypothetical protein
MIRRNTMPKKSSPEMPNDLKEGYELEYIALRAEILKRMELRYQFIPVSLTMAGVFLGLGISNGTIALVYPVLAIFLAIGWAQNDKRIGDTAACIRMNLEKSIPGLGWEKHLHDERIKEKKQRRFAIFSYGGIFLFTQLIAIGIGLIKFTYSTIDWSLLSLDLISVLIVTNTLLRNNRYK